MSFGLTDLIISQAKTLAVMFCAGIFVESLWQIKKYVQKQIQAVSKLRLWKVFAEFIFWAASGAALSAFLYYCAYGRISFHAVMGFLAGFLLWKKLFPAFWRRG